MKTRSQVYSDVIFGLVQGYVDGTRDDQQKKRYKALCKRSGGLLRTIGLVQYLTYLKAKGEGEAHYKRLLGHLAEGLSRSRGEQVAAGATELGDTLLANVRRQGSLDYMQTTREIFGLIQWHKRIADILIEGNCEEEDN